MLVFKRAIHFALSFALAFSPTLAWAAADRAPASAAPTFKAQSKSAYTKNLAKQKRSGRQAASVSASASARRSTSGAPRSLAVDPRYGKAEDSRFAYSGGVLNQFFPTYETKQGAVYLQQTEGVNGRAGMQITRANGVEEILVDEKGDGTVNRKLVGKDNITVVSTNPYNGVFTKIEIQDHRSGGNIRTLLRMNPDLKTFRLSSVKLETNKIDGYGVRVGRMCDLEPEMLAPVAAFKDIIDHLPKNSEDAMACRMNRLQELFLDPSCKTPEFQSSIKDITQALAKILTSRGTSPGRFLQCVEDRGFAFHSARIQQNFMSTLNGAMAIMNPHGFQTADAANPNSCEPLLEIADLGAGHLKPTIKVSEMLMNQVKLIKCDSKWPDVAAWDGKQVVISQTSARIVNKIGEKGATASQAYADVLMHELMHSTDLLRVPYESLVGNIGKCCASPFPDGDMSRSACAAMEVARQERVPRQNMETNLSLNVPGFNDLVEMTEGQMGGDSEEFMGNWLAALQTDPRALTAWAAIRDCEKYPTGSREKASCVEKPKHDIVNFSNGFMSKQCRPIESRLGRTIDCKALKKGYADALRTGSPLDPAALRARSNSVPVTIDGSAPIQVGTIPISILSSAEFTIAPIDVGSFYDISHIALDIVPEGTTARVSSRVVNRNPYTIVKPGSGSSRPPVATSKRSRVRPPSDESAVKANLAEIARLKRTMVPPVANAPAPDVPSSDKTESLPNVEQANTSLPTTVVESGNNPSAIAPVNNPSKSARTTDAKPDAGTSRWARSANISSTPKSAPIVNAAPVIAAANQNSNPDANQNSTNSSDSQGSTGNTSPYGGPSSRPNVMSADAMPIYRGSGATSNQLGTSNRLGPGSRYAGPASESADTTVTTGSVKTANAALQLAANLRNYVLNNALPSAQAAAPFVAPKFDRDPASVSEPVSPGATTASYQSSSSSTSSTNSSRNSGSVSKAASSSQSRNVAAASAPSRSSNTRSSRDDDRDERDKDPKSSDDKAGGSKAAGTVNKSSEASSSPEAEVAAANATSPSVRIAIARQIREVERSGWAARLPDATSVAAYLSDSKTFSNTQAELARSRPESPTLTEALLIWRNVRVKTTSGFRGSMAPNPAQCLKEDVVKKKFIPTSCG